MIDNRWVRFDWKERTRYCTVVGNDPPKRSIRSLSVIVLTIEYKGVHILFFKLIKIPIPAIISKELTHNGG